MKTAGIICEFNPFHSGHAYLLQKARQLGADRVVCLMSGDYVQRGEPAIWDRHVRARMAVLCGADLVLSFPTRYAVSSAEAFGEMAVRTLDRLGCIDLLVFGSESGDLEKLSSCAEILADEPPWYREKLRQGLKNGLSFPKARSEALPDYADLLSSPNDILGIEYLKAMFRTGASFQAAVVPRVGAGHREGQIILSDEIQYSASGNAIRKALAQSGSLKELGPVFPHAVFPLVREQTALGGNLFPDDFSTLLIEKLWKCDDAGFFAEHEGVGTDLARTFLKERTNFTTWEEFVKRCASRSLTMTHVSRALLHLALGLKKRAHSECPCFTQVLGFEASSPDFLASIAASRQGELVVNPSADLAKLTPASRSLFEEELRVSNLYEALRARKSKQKAIHEFSRPLIKMNTFLRKNN